MSAATLGTMSVTSGTATTVPSTNGPADSASVTGTTASSTPYQGLTPYAPTTQEESSEQQQSEEQPVHHRGRKKSSVHHPGPEGPLLPHRESGKSRRASNQSRQSDQGVHIPRPRRRSSIHPNHLAQQVPTSAPPPAAPEESVHATPAGPHSPLIPFFAVSVAPSQQGPAPAPYSTKARPSVPPPPLPPRLAALAAVKGLPTMSGVIPKSVLEQTKKDRSGQPTMWEVADHPNTRDDLHDLRFRTRLRLPLVPMADYQTEKQRLGEDPLTCECPWRTYPRRPKNPQAMTPRLVHENFRVWSIDTRQIQQSPKPQRAFLNKIDNTFRGPYFYAPNIKGPVRKKSYPLCKTKQAHAAEAEAAKRRPSRPSGPQEGPGLMSGENGSVQTDSTTLKSTQQTQTDENLIRYNSRRK